MNEKRYETPEGSMTFTPLPDGTYRMSALTVGEPNRRYWEKNERGDIVWQAHPEPFTVPDGVSVIGHLRCPILGEIILPEGVTRIDDLAFGAEFYASDTYEYYALHTVHLSQGLREIGYRAFFGCRALDGVHLPKGLTDIESEAFYGCRSLSRITIPESVTHLGHGAFKNCSALREVIFRGELEALNGYTFENAASLVRVLLPKGLRAIVYACFRGCTALTDLTLPDTLEEIHGAAFENCTSLTSLRFCRDLESGERMRREPPFAGCTALTEFFLESSVRRADWLPTAPALTAIRVSPDHPTFVSIDGVLYSKDKRTLLRVPGGLTGPFTVPRGVTAIAPYALCGCTGITAVSLPSSLRTVGEGAFRGMTALTALSLPGKVSEVGKEALADCTALTALHLPGSVCRIGEELLRGCAALTSLTVSPANRHYRAEGTRLIPLGE